MAVNVTLSMDQLSFILSHRDYLQRNKQEFDSMYSVGDHVRNISFEEIKKLADLAVKNLALLAYYTKMRGQTEQLLSHSGKVHGIVPGGDLVLESTELSDNNFVFVITPKGDKFVLVVRDSESFPRTTNIMGRVISINRDLRSVYDPAGYGRYRALDGIDYSKIGFLETPNGFMTPEIASVLEDPTNREIDEYKRTAQTSHVRY